MWPLSLGMILLWYTLGYRWAVLRRMGYAGNVRLLLERCQREGGLKKKRLLHELLVEALEMQAQKLPHLRKHLDDMFWSYSQELRRFNVLIKTIVYVAPLLGLLGTVSGMIETFDALQSMSLFSQTGGIAGGISQALITTQYGLAIAIPGLLVFGIMEKRRKQLEYAFDQIKDLVCSQKTA